MRCKKVNYTLLANRIVRLVTKFGRPYRLRQVVHDIEKQLDIRVDLGLIKQNLGDYVEERHIERTDIDMFGNQTPVMVVEDWVRPNATRDTRAVDTTT
jgi:hypothetical protein